MAVGCLVGQFDAGSVSFLLKKRTAHLYRKIIAGTTRALFILKRADNAKAERCASMIFDAQKS